MREATSLAPLFPESAEFAECWLRERGLDPAWGVIYPLPPKLAARNSQFLGGDGKHSPGFLLVTHDDEGRPRPELSRARYDTPHKEDRYRCPKGCGSVIYAPLPQSFTDFERSSEKHIAEGEGKTLALVGTGRAALGIGGVWNWRGPDGKLHRDLTQRIRANDTVFLWIDGDWRTNPDVHRGAYLLMEAVRGLGAKPLLMDLPTLPGLPKLGIDDQIKLWRDRNVDVESALLVLPRLEVIPSPFVVDLKKPLDTAESFLSATYSHNDAPTLLHWQGEFFTWVGRGWQSQPEELLRQQLYEFVRANGSTPKASNVAMLLDALRAAAQAPRCEAPSWLQGDGPAELLPVANGLLDLATRELLPPTPRYFNLNWSDVAYEPGADCPRWTQFVDEVYPDDPSSRACLQEFMGYCLTDDTSQQKAIALIGAKRSGKGTIARALQDLVGRSSCCNPTLASMGERFGLQTWIGKKIAVVADARTSVRNNAQAMVERVLTVTGEDSQYVDRKNRDPWEGRLRVRLWLMSNMLPATQDTGAALSSRFLILDHKVSFFGREDHDLEAKLHAEGSGILNWALEGLARLRARGYFEQPDTGTDRVREWERMNSPVVAFVQDCCELGGELFAEKSALRSSFRAWCHANGVDRVVSDSHFTQELRAACANSVTEGQRNIAERKGVRVFVGLRLTNTLNTGNTGQSLSRPKY